MDAPKDDENLTNLFDTARLLLVLVVIVSEPIPG